MHLGGKERWRPVVGHEGEYEVSDQGRIRSLDRVITFSDGRYRSARGRTLKPWTMKRVGHQVVGLTGKRKFLVHVLVLEAFVGPRPDGMVCCHNDGDATNNRVENLRWDTYVENNKDLVRHGTHWQVRKTKCPRGHDYSPENTRVYHNPNGWISRYCRECTTNYNRQYKEIRKAARMARLVAS